MTTYVPTLLESRRPLTSGGAVGGGALSFVIHAGVIAAAVAATMVTTRAVVERHLVMDVALLTQEAPPPPAAEVPFLGQPPAGFSTLEIPTTVLTEIPSPSQAPFDPTSFSGVGVASSSPWGRAPQVTARAAPVAETVYAVEVVEELPVRLSGASPEYPALLKSARIAGQVVVEFVIDTAGRVEPGSLRVLRSTNELFEAPALRAVAGWIFQPAKLGGNTVRVRAHQPLNFVM
jgi:TonB family protein